MQHRYTSLSLALLASGALLAQPTINAVNNIPAANSDYAVSSATTWAFPGEAGADQLFGHWMLVGTGNRTITYLDPSITSSSAQVPGVNLLSTDGGTDTLFWQGNADGLTILADKSGLGFIRYTDPLLELKYPCTFGTTWTDAVNATYTVQGFNVQRTGTVTGNGDAYGTLELPEVALDDILRVKVRRVITDASPIVTIQRISETYYFFSADVRHPVLRLNVDTAIINNGAPAVARDAAWMYGNGNVSVGELDLDQVRFTAYPNPADNVVNLSFGSAEHGTRSIELIDATGRMVQQLPLVQRNTIEVPAAFDASGLAPGVYHIRLVGENSVLGTQRLVVQ
jgi:hypothetical protein